MRSVDRISCLILSFRSSCSGIEPYTVYQSGTALAYNTSEKGHWQKMWNTVSIFLLHFIQRFTSCHPLHVRLSMVTILLLHINHPNTLILSIQKRKVNHVNNLTCHMERGAQEYSAMRKKQCNSYFRKSYYLATNNSSNNSGANQYRERVAWRQRLITRRHYFFFFVYISVFPLDLTFWTPFLIFGCSNLIEHIVSCNFIMLVLTAKNQFINEIGTWSLFFLKKKILLFSVGPEFSKSYALEIWESIFGVCFIALYSLLFWPLLFFFWIRIQSVHYVFGQI